MNVSIIVPEIVLSHNLDPSERFVRRTEGEKDGTQEQISIALGALAADREFTQVGVRGSNGATSAFFGVVDGILNGLESLEPPRRLVNLNYVQQGPREHETVAYITTQKLSSQPNPGA